LQYLFASILLAGDLCWVCATVQAQQADVINGQKLSGSQIRARFVGMELTDEVHYRDVYDRDGTLRSYSMGSTEVGRWAIESDSLCHYLNDPDDGCYAVSISGDRIDMKPVGLGMDIEGILQAPSDRPEQQRNQDR
jgi:hypothetical protein